MIFRMHAEFRFSIMDNADLTRTCTALAVLLAGGLGVPVRVSWRAWLSQRENHRGVISPAFILDELQGLL